MFKKQFRLNTSEFNEVFNFGKNIKTPYFLIKLQKNKINHPRFSVVVSKKISKKAHQRNYLKRKFYHALKENIKNFNSCDYIFILNSQTKDIQYKDLLQIIKTTKI